MNRRDFLKKSAAVGATVTIATVAANGIKPDVVDAAVLTEKTYESIDQMINIDSNMKRFDMANTAFNKGVLDMVGIVPLPEDHILRKNSMMNMGFDHKDQPPGRTQIDYALGHGAAALESATTTGRIHSGDSGVVIQLENGELFNMSLYRQKDPSGNRLSAEVSEHKYKFKARKDASYAVKKAAKLYGADLVGIAPFEERWLYNTEVYIPTSFYTGQPILDKVNPFRPVDLGFKPKSVIVLAYEMDYEAYKTHPSAIGGAATTVGYSRMLENSLKVATFIRELGYNAHHAGNDTGLSVPLAIQAGLGEGSRMGLLITKKYGPRVRLAKVYTDLELEFDKPKAFGVKEFCEVCQKCSDACPSESLSKIPKTTDQENKPRNSSNLAGIDKWFNDGAKCLGFWSENREECGVCISVCPYNKIDEWHHKFAQVATEIPGLRNVARYLDEFFGYGKAPDEKSMVEYWEKSI